MPNYVREPGVASREQVVGYMGNSVPSENMDLLTYVQIVAETGPTDPVVISGLSQLLNNFTYSKTLSAAYPKCFLEAAFLANLRMPLLVQRIAPQVNSKNESKVTFSNADNEPIFEIVHNYPNTQDIIRLKVTLSGTQAIKISIESIIYDSVNPDNSTVLFTETYDLSTDPASVSAVGTTNSVDIINDYRADIKVNLINPKGVVSKITSTSGSVLVPETGAEASVYFGKSTDKAVRSWYEGDTTNAFITAWNDAITSLPDWEGDIPAYIMSTTCPAHDNQQAFERLMQEAAADIKAWPIYNPYLTDYSYDIVKTLGPVYGSTTSLGKLCVPGFYDTTLLGRKLLLGGGFDYMRTIVSNYYSGKGYAAIMGTSGAGTAACGTSLAVRYTKSQRLELLNMGLTPIKWHSRKKIAYFTMNNSVNTLDDSISEEQNRRIMNKASHDMDDRLDDMVGKYNIDETRSRVEEMVAEYQKFELKNYSAGAVVELLVKCNVDNNTPGIINANRLEVEIGIRFNRAIRWVNILYKILPVASE